MLVKLVKYTPGFMFNAMLMSIMKPRYFNVVCITLSLITSTALLIGIALIFISPPDRQHGMAVRLMYVHVPFAWLSLLGYSAVTIFSIATFIWKNAIIRIIAQQIAKCGTLFCALALLTGSLWGKPIWNTYWAWDARTVFTVCLFLTYISYLVVADAHRNNPNGDKILAIVGIIGAINIPFIKFSVKYWHTLHQPASIFWGNNKTVAQQFSYPLFIMLVGFAGLYAIIVFISTTTVIMRSKFNRATK